MTVDLQAQIINVRDFMDRFEELENQRTEKWIAGCNMPGYMPDMDPCEFEDVDSAIEYICDEVESLMDDESRVSEEEIPNLKAIIKLIKLETGEFTTGNLYGCVYWVKRDGFMGLDESEQEELDTLTAILESLRSNGGDEKWRGDWYPSQLIANDYFEDYCKELLSDMGDLPRNIPHYIEIDWHRTAENIQQDYASVDILDNTYWYR